MNDDKLTAADYRGIAAKYRLEATRAENRGDEERATKLRNYAALYEYLGGDEADDESEGDDER